MARKKESYNDQTQAELEVMERDLSKEIYDMKCELATLRKLEKPHLVKAKKRERARVLTAIAQKRSGV